MVKVKISFASLLIKYIFTFVKLIAKSRRILKIVVGLMLIFWLSKNLEIKEINLGRII